MSDMQQPDPDRLFAMLHALVDHAEETEEMLHAHLGIPYINGRLDAHNIIQEMFGRPTFDSYEDMPKAPQLSGFMAATGHPTCVKCGKTIEPGTYIDMVSEEDIEQVRIMTDDQVLVSHAECP